MIAAAHLSMRSRAEHLRRQRDERWLDSRGFLGMQPNPFVDEVGIEAVLWNAIRSDDWAIPHVGLSSLGESVGWARPDEFPPRNMQTSKGLRALGYNVRIGV